MYPPNISNIDFYRAVILGFSLGQGIDIVGVFDSWRFTEPVYRFIEHIYEFLSWPVSQFMPPNTNKLFPCNSHPKWLILLNSAELAPKLMFYLPNTLETVLNLWKQFHNAYFCIIEAFKFELRLSSDSIGGCGRSDCGIYFC